MVAHYLCLIAQAKASNMCSSLANNERTTFKTVKSLARMTDCDVSIALEVHNEVDGSLEKYRKQEEEGKLGGRSRIHKERG